MADPTKERPAPGEMQGSSKTRPLRSGIGHGIFTRIHEDRFVASPHVQELLKQAIRLDERGATESDVWFNFC